MLTLRQLFKRTTEDRKQRAMYVKVLQMKTGHTKEGLGFVAAKTRSTHIVNGDGKLVRNPKPTTYVSMIIFIDRKLNCHVSCSCDDNLYRWEYANAGKNAAEIEYSNGEPPIYTNPGYKPGLCKHLVSLYLKIQPKLPSGY